MSSSGAANHRHWPKGRGQAFGDRRRGRPDAGGRPGSPPSRGPRVCAGTARGIGGPRRAAAAHYLSQLRPESPPLCSCRPPPPCPGPTRSGGAAPPATSPHARTAVGTAGGPARPGPGPVLDTNAILCYTMLYYTILYYTTLYYTM